MILCVATEQQLILQPGVSTVRGRVQLGCLFRLVVGFAFGNMPSLGEHIGKQAG